MVHPVAYRLSALDAVRNMAKFAPREIHQLVRIAVAARQRIAKDGDRRLLDRNRMDRKTVVVGHARHRENRVVQNLVAPGISIIL